MWIRSQNNHILANVNSLRICKGDIDGCVYYSIHGHYDRYEQELGIYSTKEKAMEVLNDIYFEYLSKRKMMDFALVDGRVVQCLGTHCGECDFNGDCIERKFKWLKQPYEKPKYELSQFEFDLIKTFDCCKECCLLNEIECIKKLREKGYFNGIDPFTKVHDIIDNCEVIQ